MRTTAALVLGGTCAGIVAQGQPQVSLDDPGPVCPGEDWVTICNTTATEVQGFEVAVTGDEGERKCIKG